MTKLIVDHNDKTIGRIVRACFPRNRKAITVREFRGPVSMNSYWDGGSKDVHVLYCLATGRTWTMPTSHPYFDRRPDGERCGNLELSELPPNTVLVSGGTFCGKPASVTVRVRPDNLATLIPSDDGVELTPCQRRALSTVGSIKSSYRADEFKRHGLGDYGPNNPHIVALEALKLVKINKAGAVAITTAGRNCNS